MEKNEKSNRNKFAFLGNTELISLIIAFSMLLITGVNT